MNAFILRSIEAGLYHNLIEFIFEVGFFDSFASRRDDGQACRSSENSDARRTLFVEVHHNNVPIALGISSCFQLHVSRHYYWWTCRKPKTDRQHCRAWSELEQRDSLYPTPLWNLVHHRTLLGRVWRILYECRELFRRRVSDPMRIGVKYGKGRGNERFTLVAVPLQRSRASIPIL